MNPGADLGPQDFFVTDTDIVHPVSVPSSRVRLVWPKKDAWWRCNLIGRPVSPAYGVWLDPMKLKRHIRFRRLP